MTMASSGDDVGLLSTLLEWGSVGAMIFGGVVPYVPQYKEIQTTENADGFSLHVCLALLVANTLRILFWFGHPFELPLLIQSVIMNVTMLLLVHLCVRVRNKNQLVKNTRERFFSDFDHHYFWSWTDFTSYLEFMVTFTCLVGLSTYVFLDSLLFVETIGFLAVFIEAMLGIPQFMRNLRSKSTKGMSKKMVVMWLSGDIFKTGYFIGRNSPIQFWLCGILQVSVDIAILLQAAFYHRSMPHHHPSTARHKPDPYVS